MPFDWATFAAGLLTAGATAFGFYYAGKTLKQSAMQHAAAEKWRRTEFAARLTSRLSEDQEISFITQAVDWGVGPLIVPERYRPLFTDGSITFEHDWTIFAKAARPQLQPGYNDPRFLTYRYCLDSFGSYLETIQRHIDLGNVEPEHVVGLKYYLDKLITVPYSSRIEFAGNSPNVAQEQVLGEFIAAFYPGAFQLVQQRTTSGIR
jgi:hypothetical protein